MTNTYGKLLIGFAIVMRVLHCRVGEGGALRDSGAKRKIVISPELEQLAEIYFSIL